MLPAITLTPVSMHKGALKPGEPEVPFGTGNRCTVFPNNYLEILAWVEKDKYDFGVRKFLELRLGFRRKGPELVLSLLAHQFTDARRDDLWIGFERNQTKASVQIVTASGGWTAGITHGFGRNDGISHRPCSPVLEAWEWFGTRIQAAETRPLFHLHDTISPRPFNSDERTVRSRIRGLTLLSRAA